MKRGRFGHGGAVGTLELHMRHAGFDAGLLEYVGQADAGPNSVAYGSLEPRKSRNGWREQGPAVAGTLQNRGNGNLGKFRKISERERKLVLDAAVDADGPGIDQSDAGRSEVAANEEEVVRRVQAFEDLDGCLEIERPAVADDQLWPFARVLGRGGTGGKAGGEAGGEGGREKVATHQIGVSILHDEFRRCA